MNDLPAGDDALADVLAACDEALADGEPAAFAAGAGLPPGQARLLKNLECVRLLRQVWPRQDSTLTDAAPPGAGPPAPPERLGRFQIARELGRGGFGVVYLAFDPQLARRVALKIPRPDVLTTPLLRERFRLEARAAAALDHPNIVAVHEAGDVDGVAYIAAAYCRGVSLASWLEARPDGVPVYEAAALLAQLADGVDHAHRRGVLHRDLKPANVMLETPAGGDGEWVAKITDFGLARTLGDMDANLTATGAILGTPNYLAPEQADGQRGPVGPAADVHGLGAVLYEMLTRRPPFVSDNALDTLRQVRHDDPIPPRKLRAQIPRDLETICLKCLEKDPRHRYPTAAALAADLRRFGVSEPILARPPGALGRAAKWVRRKPTVAGLAAGIVAVAVLGFAGVLWQWRQTVVALGQERRALDDAKVQLYLNRIAQAQHEFQLHNVSRAERLLDECPPELRGWEWRYVSRLCRTDLFLLPGNGRQVHSLAASPDGRWLLAGSGDWGPMDGETDGNGLLNLWDAKTGKLDRTLSDRIGTVYAVAFHPDSRRAVSAGADSLLRLWDAATGEVLREFTPPDAKPGAGRGVKIYAAALSPDGRLLASAGSDQKVRVWDVETGRHLRAMAGHQSVIWGVAFSPDGAVLASCDYDGTARLWAPAWGMPLGVLTGSSDLRGIAFSPDGRTLAAASFGGPILLWDVSKPGPKPVYQHPNASAVLGVAFSPDGRSLAWHSRDGSVRLRDPRTGRDAASFRKHDGWVSAVAFGADGRTLATGGMDGNVRIWDVTAREEPPSVLTYGTTLPGLNYDPDGRLVALGSLQNRAGIWDTASRKELTGAAGQAGPLTAAAVSPDGKSWVFVGQDLVLKSVGRADGKEQWAVPLPAGPVTAVAYSTDGRRVAWGGVDGFVRLLDAATGAEVRAFGAAGCPVTGAAFHPAGDRLATAGPDGIFRVWAVTTGEELARFGEAAAGQAAPAHRLDPTGNSGVTRLAFSPDGRRLAAATPLRPLTLWDVSAGRVALILDWDNEGSGSVAWSADGQRLAAAQGRRIKVWDVGERTPESLRQAAAARAPAWRAGEAGAAETRGDWPAAIFHLTWLIAETPAAAPAAERALLLGRRGYCRVAAAVARQRGWDAGVADLDEALRLDPRHDSVAYVRALLLLTDGERARYAALCQALLAGTGKDVPPDAANNIAWTCCLAPGVPVDWDRVVAMAARMVRERPNDRNCASTLAAALCRAGRFKESLAEYANAVKLKASPDAVMPDWLFMALAHHGSNDPARARACLDKAAEWLRKNRETAAAGEEPTAAWETTLEVRLLHAEVTALLAAGP